MIPVAPSIPVPNKVNEIRKFHWYTLAVRPVYQT